MKLKWIMTAVAALMLAACAAPAEKEGAEDSGPKVKTKLVVLVDPALADFAQFCQTRYDTLEGDLDITIEVQPSETIFEQLKAGKKADLVMAFNAESRRDIQWHKMNVLALDRVVMVRCKNRERAAEFKSADCYALGHSGGPLREQTDQWIKNLKETRRDPELQSQGMVLSQAQKAVDSCTVVANSSEQMRDYLARGWVKGGFCFQSTAKLLLNQAVIVDQAPMIREAWAARIPSDRMNPKGADAFLDFIFRNDIKPRLALSGFAIEK